MKKRLMIFFTILLVAFMVAAPLIGSAQAFKISRIEPVTLSRVNTNGGYVDFLGDTKNVGNLFIATPLRGTENWLGTLTFDDTSTIEFVSQTNSYIVANLDTLTGHTMTKWTLSNNDGGFKGTLLLDTTYLGTMGPFPGFPRVFPNIYTATSDYKAVLIGYGEYQGQKIVLSGTGPYRGPYEGFLIAK